MDKIQQLENNKKISIVWYGVCGEDCAEYELTDSTNATEVEKIDHIYEISDDETKPIFYSSFSDHVHGFDQTLQKLKCGHAYYLVLKKGEEILDIPNLTQAHEGITAGKISQSCILAPELTFTDLVPVVPSNLKLQLTVDITDLIAPCAANTWKYKVIRVSNGQELGPFDGDNSTNPVVVQTPVMPSGGEEYTVSIWGVGADGERITDPPDQEKTIYLPYPSAGLNIVGAVDLEYLEFQGPAESGDLSFSGDESLIEKLVLIKPSKSDPVGSDDNIDKWMYSLDSGANYHEYASLSDDGLEVQYSDKIKWKLKKDLSAGGPTDTSTSYDSTMVIKYVLKNADILYPEKDLLGKVVNRKISITSFSDERNLTAQLDVNLTELTRWRYKLERINSNAVELAKDFDAFLSAPTENVTIDIASIIEDSNLGPGTYRVTVQGYHDTDDGIVVTPIDTADQILNWPVPVVNINENVNVSYREYEAPTNPSPEVITITPANYVDTLTFKATGNLASWRYGINTTPTLTPLPSTDTTIPDINSGDVIKLIFVEDQKANEGSNKSYATSVTFDWVGKDNLLSTNGTVATETLNIQGEVRDRRIINLAITDTSSTNPSWNLFALRADFQAKELSRYDTEWSLSGVSVDTQTIDLGTSYTSNRSDPLLIDLNTPANIGTYTFSAIGKHTDPSETTIFEPTLNWIAGQVSPKVEATYDVGYPTPSFEVTSSVSDSFQEGTGPSASGKNVSVTKYHWLDHYSVKFSGNADSIWEYKTSGGDWTDLSAAEVSVAPAGDPTEFRVKATATEGTTAETLNWTATGLDGTSLTDTTTLNANITPGEVLPDMAWIGFGASSAAGNKYSPWYKLDVIESEFTDLTDAIAAWNGTNAGVKAVMQQKPLGGGLDTGCDGLSSDYDITETTQLSACKHRGSMMGVATQDPIGNVVDPTVAGDNTMAKSDAVWALLDGKTITNIDGILGVYIDLDYTKFEIASEDADTAPSSLYAWASSNDISEIPWIVITTYPTRPDNDAANKPWNTLAFDSDTFRMKCGGVWQDASNIDPSLVSNLRISGATSSSAPSVFRYPPTDPAARASGAWEGVGLIFNTTDPIPVPTSGEFKTAETVPFSQLKLEVGNKDTGVFKKLSSGNPAGSVC